MTKFVKCIDDMDSENWLQGGFSYEVLTEDDECYFLKSMSVFAWGKDRFEVIGEKSSYVPPKPMTEQRKRQIKRLMAQCSYNAKEASDWVKLYNKTDISSFREQAVICQDLAADYYNLIAVLRFED